MNIRLALLLSLGVFLFSETKIFYKEATYTMGDNDTRITAKTQAILLAKREAIEEAGVVVVRSFSKVKKAYLQLML